MGYSNRKLSIDRVAVERFFAWLANGFRRLAIRWERLASTFTGFIQLACIIIYLRVSDEFFNNL
jgi:transposase